MNYTSLCWYSIHLATLLATTMAVLISGGDEQAFRAHSLDVPASSNSTWLHEHELAHPSPVHDVGLVVPNPEESTDTPEDPPAWMVQEPLIPVNGRYPGQAPPQPIDPAVTAADSDGVAFVQPADP
eukprot:TRINITY_DN2892_c0_g2_i1.p1 TRINITY_DN2892_c0_g2~~TRINITY_DN2892_c0_g2_i1.p1  ORF type:complete len:126 (-),score=7.02 TRINITY_DN2892_c0_g2_i1:196-573(-)